MQKQAILSHISHRKLRLVIAEKLLHRGGDNLVYIVVRCGHLVVFFFFLNYPEIIVIVQLDRRGRIR